MADSLNKLWLKGQAEEDIYFAERDRELIAALRKKRARNESADAGHREGKDATSAASTPATDSKKGSENDSGNGT
ncbi:MAG: hypothetical protein AB2598_14735 [Candidatus Thiodiazotropha sp.]